MGKLYLFGIGGTGSRVLRSLTMLLASGVKINASEIIPVVIDAYTNLQDLTRTSELIKTYNKIRQALSFDAQSKNEFWQATFNLNDLSLPLSKATNELPFREFIGYPSMSRENQAFASLLFSEKNLNADMSVGFKGNPNIGTVVLNQFNSIDQFQQILSNFEDGDRIFIISSIFGGTGASGFPLLAKNLRSLGDEFQQAGRIMKAPMGAITVLPYFDLKQDENSSIDSSTFTAKTKAALKYYDQQLNEINVLYYIADSLRNQYENHDGGPEQKNNAHFIELAAALSIIDFMAISDNDPSMNVAIADNQNHTYQPASPIYKEFAIEEEAEKLNFTNLCDETNQIIRYPLSQFVLFAKYILEHMDEKAAKPWREHLKIDNNFKNTDFYKHIKEFVEDLFKWYDEMRDNTRSFEPFYHHIEKDRLFSYIHGVEPKKRFLGLKIGDQNYNKYDQILNALVKDQYFADKTQQQQFIELFYRATQELIKEELTAITL